MATMNLAEATAVKAVSDDNCVLVAREGALRRVRVGVALDDATKDLFLLILADLQQAFGG